MNIPNYSLKTLAIFVSLLAPWVACATDYHILDFGAGRGQLSTAAIQKTVDACHAGGGGRVIVPEGVFITGTIVPKSHVDLYLGSGAVLKGSTRLADYQLGNQLHGLVFAKMPSTSASRP
jgi:polygalacturonase